LTVFIIFLVAAFFFAYAETAIIAAERVFLRHASREGSRRAKLVEAFRDNPRRFFGATLVGSNICIVILSAVGAHELLPSLGVSVVLATLIVDLIILIIAEITPKTLSLSNPTANSMKAAGLLELAARLLAPAIWFLTWLPSLLVNIDGIFHSREQALITESQLVHMIHLGAKEGTIDEDESRRAVRVFRFADTTVARVMIPKLDVVHLNVGDGIRKALELANSTGYSRIPVLTMDGNNSPGFISVKDILVLYGKGKLDEPVDSYLRPIRFVPESKRILPLLDEFRKGNEQLVLVVDEFGNTTGVVTLEDLLEEVLGEIYDEYDPAAPEVKWTRGALAVPGTYPAYKLSDQLNVKPPGGDFDTTAGWFLDLLGRVPSPGESVVLDATWELTATHVVGHRITRLVARRRGHTSAADPEPAK
jgi:CBS domain containing-hemolysin-like protein